MIIDNFGTIKPNPCRWYRPRIIMPIVDEAQNLAEIEKWARSPHIMVLPEPAMSGEYRDLVERATKRPRLPTLEQLERATLERAQDGLMRAVRRTRIQHDEMRQAGSLGEWHAAAAVEGLDA